MPNPDKYINLTELGRFKTKILNEISNSYLGKTATAADSSKLNGQSASYYLNYNNLTNKPSIPTESTVSGWGFTKLTIGISSTTAAAGNHDHDGVYLSSQGGELMSGNMIMLTLYNKNTGGSSNDKSTYIRFKYAGQDTKRWLIGAESGDDGFYIHKENGASSSKVFWLDRADDSAHVAGDIYENGDKLSSKYYPVNNPNGYTSNTGTVIGSGLTANTIILGNGGVNIKTSSYTIAPSSTTWSDSDDTKLPTMKSIAAKIASGGGGSTKYLHNITAWWQGGSGDDYRSGTLSFSFYDTNPNSYEDTSGDMDMDDFKLFFATHCFRDTTLSSFKQYPVNGSISLGSSPVNNQWHITSIVNAGYGLSGMWYVAGGYISRSSNGTIAYMGTATEEINYLETAMYNQWIRMTDIVQ